MSRRLFGTNGIRGIIGQDFTPIFIAKIGQAIGTYFSGKSILIAKDARTSSDFIANIIKACLVASGCEVYDLGYTPTPVMQYLVKREKFDGGVMITASHNPPEYNGIKVIGPNGIEIPRREEEKIENMFWEEKFSLASYDHVGKVHNVEYLTKNYIDDVISRVNIDKIRRSNFKIIIDCANSVASTIVPEVLRKVGVKFVSINANLDGTFPGRLPEPIPETLKDTISMTMHSGAHFGVAYDGDVDRAIFITREGEVLWGDRSGALLTMHLAEKEKKSNIVVTPVSSSVLVEEVLSNYGLKIEWTPVGSIHVSYKILETNALTGFEENGGFLYPKHHPVRDGIMTTILMLEYLAESKKTLTEAYRELPRYHPVKTKVKLEDRGKVSKIIEEIARKFESYRQVRIDGVKVFLDNGWFLIRPSGTEALIRIFVEHKEKKEAENLANSLVNLVKELIKTI